jgi:myosin heavy subunit
MRREQRRNTATTISPVNLTELLLNSTAEQAQESQAPAPSKANANNGTTAAATGDQFTLSAQNAAQAAGLFTVSQVTLFSAAAEALLAQAAAPPPNPANTTAPAANFSAAPAAQESVAANSAAAAPALAAATALATSATANAAAANAAAAPVTTASVAQQLQTLNSALVALGLSQADINKIDSVAGFINDFNPAAFTNLANQLETLAQPQTAPQTAANAPATANASAANANTANANTNAANTAAANPNAANVANTNPPALQIQELLIRFSGAGAPGATGGTGAVIAPNPNGPLPASAPNLQVELSLTDNNGHAIRVSAPAEAVNANPPAGGNQAPAQTGVATA